LTALEALTPEQTKTRERFDLIREKHESAGEHYRALLQKTTSAELGPEAADEIRAEANDIIEELTVAEQERMKLPGAKSAMKKTSSSAAPSSGY
jgi:hypothetical protein